MYTLQFYKGGGTFPQKLALAIILLLTILFPNIILAGNGSDPTTTTIDGKTFYQISSADNLYWFAEKINEGNLAINAILTDNIVVNQAVLINGELNENKKNEFKTWTPICLNIDKSEYSFCGIFDGNGHTISGLYFNDETKNNVGLFSKVTSPCKIKNLGIIDSYFKGNYYVGAIIGCNGNYTSSLINCYNTGNVSGNQYVGGLIGDGNYIIQNCYNTGNVSGNQFVGGLTGTVVNIIQNCYNVGNVSGNKYVGGLCSSMHDVAKNCYNAGIVSGDSYKYELFEVPFSYMSDISNCYYLKEDKFIEYHNDGTEGYSSKKLAYLLQKGEYAPIWGYDENISKYPIFSDTPIDIDGKNITSTDYNNGIAKLDDQGYFVCQKPETDENGTFKISNMFDLFYFASYADKKNDVNAILTNNIKVNENLLDNNGDLIKANIKYNWPLIMNYSGIFNGNGHSISGLYCESNCFSISAGMFIELTNATIMNLGLEDSYFYNYNEDRYNVGGAGSFCGECRNSIITNCYNSSTVHGNSDNGYGGVGGLCGTAEDNSTISNCYNIGKVIDDYPYLTGGICGWLVNNDVTITNCYYLASSIGNDGARTEEEFKNGSVATALYDGTDGTIWGQNVSNGDDNYPTFGKELKLKVMFDIASIDPIIFEYKSSKDLTSLVTPEPCYEFAWYSTSTFDNGTKVENTNTIKSNIKLFGKTSPIEYTITYNGASESSNPISYNIESETITLKSPEIPIGYSLFEGWYDEKGNKVEIIKNGSFGDLTLTAKFIPTIYNIEYKNAEKGENPESYTIESENITLKTPIVPVGYSFEGWYDEKGNKVEIIKNGSFGDLILTAKFQDDKTPVSQLQTVNNINIWSSGNIIYVENAESEIYVIDLSGRIVKIQKPQSSHEEITINKSGIYIIKINNKTIKVAIQ